MVTLPQLLSFVLAAVLITCTPGPDNLMVLSIGMSKGRKQGIAFGLGCATGCLSHTVLAVVGVSAVVAASPFAFAALKWIGGGYLIWLGLMALRSSGRRIVASDDGVARASLRQCFFKGMVANAINPKVILFFLSFLPQFVMPEHGNIAVQLGLLGVVFAAQAVVVFGMLAWFAGSIGAWLHRTPGASAWLDRVAGTVFVALGIRMLATR